MQEANRPHVLEIHQAEDRKLFETLVSSGVQLHDTLAQQLDGLLQTRSPHRKLTKEELLIARKEFLQPYTDKGLTFGTWVYFSWRRVLVRLLPKDLYHELRTNRNRHKITDEEQSILRKAVVAVVGLSAGSSIAITLAMQGIGYRFKIADFDHLEVSNLNRLQAGVVDLGENKAFITARRLYEIDPYLEVDFFPEGVTQQNLDSFLHGASILFEECDSFDIKVTLRKKARQVRVPVIMLSSDSGLVDIERFDLEPHRPLFHGLAEEIDMDALERGDWQSKLEFAARTNNPAKVSQRMLASVVELEQSILTWPQLASDVVLGGALGAHVAKDVLLGNFKDSGRFYFDPAKVFVDDSPHNEYRLPYKRKEGEKGIASSISPRSHDLPPDRQQLASLVSKLLSGSASIDVENNFLRDLVRFGQRAPSGGNAQPWLFVRVPNWVQSPEKKELPFSLMCKLNPNVPAQRSTPNRLPDFIALGAAVENMVIALKGSGVRGRVTWCDSLIAPKEIFSSSSSSQVAQSKTCPEGGAVLSFVLCKKGEEDVAEDDLVEAICKRVANRNDTGSATPLDEPSATVLRNACEGIFDGNFLLSIRPNDAENEKRLEEFGAVCGELERVRYLSPIMRSDLIDEIRWSEEEARGRRDGLDLPSLQLPPGAEIHLQLLKSEEAMELLRKCNLGRALTRGSKLRIARSRAVAMLSTKGNTLLPSVNFDSGRVVQRLWLKATAMKIGFQPMYSVLHVANFLKWQLECSGHESKLHMNKDLLKRVNEELDSFNTSPNSHPNPIFIFSLTDAPPPQELSYRRDVDSCLILPAIAKAAL